MSNLRPQKTQPKKPWVSGPEAAACVWGIRMCLILYISRGQELQAKTEINTGKVYISSAEKASDLEAGGLKMEAGVL